MIILEMLNFEKMRPRSLFERDRCPVRRCFMRHLPIMWTRMEKLLEWCERILSDSSDCSMSVKKFLALEL